MKNKYINLNTSEEGGLIKKMKRTTKAKSKNSSKGITLIALVITIIVLLILAGVTITTLMGENGIINMAAKSKDETEVGKEKETIGVAVVQTKMNDGVVKKETLQKNLDMNVEMGKTEVKEDGEDLIVEFKESNRYYKLSQSGNIETYTPYKDEEPGKLAGTGTEEEPFKIESIEDLVVFSMINEGNAKLKELGLTKNNFSEQYVTLERTLDFKSDFSYENPAEKKYGDLNKDGKEEDIKTELTKKDNGCIGFTPINGFKGMFDGKNNAINNIYENGAGSLGLFNIVYTGGSIANLKLGGEMISTGRVGCIVSQIIGDCTIKNCENHVNFSASSKSGGIVGYWTSGLANIENCKNYGDISFTYSGFSELGGIAGQLNGGSVKNCENFGSVVSTSGSRLWNSSRSVLFGSYGGTFVVDHCLNYGQGFSSGIVRKSESYGK